MRGRMAAAGGQIFVQEQRFPSTIAPARRVGTFPPFPPPPIPSLTPIRHNGAMAWDADIDRAVAHLRAGGIVVYPTGSYLAAGVLATLPEAVARLALLKGRPATKPFGVIVAGEAALVDLGVVLGEAAAALGRRFWPGPLSLVLPLTPTSPLRAAYPGGTVAVRVPGHPVALALASACGGAITATSANRTGAPPVTAVADLGAEWHAPDLVVLGDEPAAGGRPSTIVDLRSGQLTVVRVGRISVREIAAAP